MATLPQPGQARLPSLAGKARPAPHLCQEVDFEACGLVGFGLSIVEIVAHGQHKLWKGKCAGRYSPPLTTWSIRMRLQAGCPQGAEGQVVTREGCVLTSRILASFRLFLSSREAWRKHSRLPRISSVFSCSVAWKWRLRRRVLYSGTDSICQEGRTRIMHPSGQDGQETHCPIQPRMGVSGLPGPGSPLGKISTTSRGHPHPIYCALDQLWDLALKGVRWDSEV